MTEMMFEAIYRESFPFWEKLSYTDREYICQNSYGITYPKGKNIHDGGECSGVIIVRSGSLRLYMMSDEGKEIRFTVSTKAICVCCLPPAYCQLSRLRYL